MTNESSAVDRIGLVIPPWRLWLPLLLAGAACAQPNFFPGTKIPRTEYNQAVLDTIEQYRQRLVEKNVEGLMVLASKKYFEDSGTPRADDDYGYDGLREVLSTRIQRVKAIRYDIEYRKLATRGSQVEVQVFINGAFELSSEQGDRYRPVSDYWRFVLEMEDSRWRFVSGM